MNRPENKKKVHTKVAFSPCCIYRRYDMIGKKNREEEYELFMVYRSSKKLDRSIASW